MTSDLLITNCGQLLTLRGPNRPRTGAELPDLGLVADGAVLIRRGKIARAGPRAEVEPHASKQAERHDAGGRVVMPGFVDAHTHLVFAGHRAGEFERRAHGETYPQIAAAGGGILATVRATRAATEDELVANARRHATWMLRNGTTTIEAKSGYGLSTESELKILRAVKRLAAEGPQRIVPTFLGAHAVPPEYAGQLETYADHVIRDMLPRVAAEKLASYCDVFCEPHIFHREAARRILAAAKKLRLGLRLHVDQLSLSRGAELAAELGAATADHLEHTGAAGIAALQAAGVQPVLLPGSVYALGHTRYPAARAMIAAGLAVVLATDFNPGTSPTPSIPMILSLAVTQLRLSPAEAVTAATINAACSLGLGRELGSLEPGKHADLVIHDCADYRELACFFGFDTARAVFIGGRKVYERL